MAHTSQFCTFYLDKLLFGVELKGVQEVIRSLEMTKVPLAPEVVSGLINLRGQIVTAVDLRRRLELDPAPPDMQPMNVVVRSEDGAVSLLVDEIGDVVEVDETSFEPPPETLRGSVRAMIVGVHKLNDRLMLVLDIERACHMRFLCQDTCHVIRDHDDNKEAFSGPRFFLRYAELDMHPNDALDRRKMAQDGRGLGMCNITKCCTEVCPENIKITDNTIIPMKERVVDVKYDPIRFLNRRRTRKT